MKMKYFGFLIMLLIAFVLISGGVTGGSVAEGVYLPLPGVSEYVYKADFATKGLSKLSAINKNVEINFGKDNYLLDGGTVKGTGIGVYVRPDSELPKNTNNFSQAYGGIQKYWIIKPLSKLYTIRPVDDLSDFNNVSGTGGHTDYSMISPAAITFKYDIYFSDAYDNVAVLYRKDDGSAWEILPAVVNAGAKSVTATFSKDGFGSYCVVNMDCNFREFSGTGIPGVNWAQQYVTPLWSKGLLSQTRDSGYFGLVYGSSPAGYGEYKMTRGEFAFVLVKGMRLPLDDNLNDIFSDLNVTLQETSQTPNINYDYYYPDWDDYAYTSAKYGLFNGFRDGDNLTFKPNGYITREQAAALIARAAKLKLETDNEDGGKVDQGLAKLYKDYASVSRWARPYVLAVSKAKYMEGIPDPADAKKKDKLFEATDPVTRAQTAKIMYKFLKNLKTI